MYESYIMDVKLNKNVRIWDMKMCEVSIKFIQQNLAECTARR